ncbi:MAG TPA: ferredoxin reductase [Pseudonocardia sp.]|nr:ferredoxin reductase [Pseudonocardia sp.]
MARAAVRRRLTWALARVERTTAETPRARRLHLAVPGWGGHLAGQHVDVRLTAEDGYTAQRSYSIASPPGADGLELVVERLDDGEVSPYLTDVLRPGDDLELRGPIGRYFVWPPSGPGGGAVAAGAAGAWPGDPRGDRPVQLVAGGSGVVPFLAMAGHHRLTGSAVPMRLLYSSRTLDDVIGRAELDRAGPGVEVTITLTRGAPPDWTGPTGRLDRALLRRHAMPPHDRPLVYVCGPTGFVEHAADELVALGHAAEHVRTERFGPSGGAP